MDCSSPICGNVTSHLTGLLDQPCPKSVSEYVEDCLWILFFFLAQLFLTYVSSALFIRNVLTVLSLLPFYWIYGSNGGRITSSDIESSKLWTWWCVHLYRSSSLVQNSFIISPYKSYTSGIWFIPRLFIFLSCLKMVFKTIKSLLLQISRGIIPFTGPMYILNTDSVSSILSLVFLTYCAGKTLTEKK